MSNAIRLSWFLGSLSIIGLAAACGGGNDVTPTIVSGGGVSSGSIDGEVNVYVIDDDTDAPIAGATVVVGAIVGETDGDGLFVAAGDGVSGPQTITALADDYTSSTFVGANGANVTIPLSLLEPIDPGDVPQATVTGTVEGFTALAPASGSIKVALVNYTATDDDEDPANELDQGGQPKQPPPNSCVNPGVGPPPACAWSLKTRTGDQVVFALIGDFNPATEAFTIDGFAYQDGITVTDGDDQSGLLLTMVDQGDLIEPDLTVPSAPDGTDVVQTIIRMDLGDEGLLSLPQATELSVPVPETSVFPGSTYQVLAIASSETDADAQSVSFTRGLDSVETATVASFIDLPAGLSADGTTFEADAVEGATVHLFGITDAVDGTSYWSVIFLDDTTTVELVEQVVIPDGAMTFGASAILLGGDFDVQDFSIDDVQDTVTNVSTAGVDFTN